MDPNIRGRLASAPIAESYASPECPNVARILSYVLLRVALAPYVHIYICVCVCVHIHTSFYLIFYSALGGPSRKLKPVQSAALFSYPLKVKRGNANTGVLVKGPYEM